MANQNMQVLLGTRVPLSVKEKLARYCIAHGIKMNYFVTEAIKERLLEVSEDKEDLLIAKDRLKDAKFISQQEMGKYIAKRGVKQ
jgi:predicted DNA-binding protein